MRKLALVFAWGILRASAIVVVLGISLIVGASTAQPVYTNVPRGGTDKAVPPGQPWIDLLLKNTTDTTVTDVFVTIWRTNAGAVPLITGMDALGRTDDFVDDNGDGVENTPESASERNSRPPAQQSHTCRLFFTDPVANNGTIDLRVFLDGTTGDSTRIYVEFSGKAGGKHYNLLEPAIVNGIGSDSVPLPRGSHLGNTLICNISLASMQGACIFSPPDNSFVSALIDSPYHQSTVQIAGGAITINWIPQLPPSSSASVNVELANATPETCAVYMTVTAVAQNGRCCYGDPFAPSCVDFTEAQCMALGGTWTAGLNCTANPCPLIPPGQSCANPIPITNVGSWTNTTCGMVDDYNATCMGYYDGGEDIIYQLIVTSAMTVDITITSDASWVGMCIDNVCPPDASCIALCTTSGSGCSMNGVALVAGTYYIMIDTWPAPTCIPQFTLTITQCAETGRCCYNGGLNCVDNLQTECTALGGTWTAGATCEANPCLVPLTCPEASLYSNPPWPPDSILLIASDDAADTAVIGEFDSQGWGIGGVYFWGVSRTVDGQPCEEDPMTFEVIFYEDSSGEPGSVVHSYTTTPARQATGYVIAGLPLYQFYAPFDTACVITQGWTGWVGFQRVSYGVPTNCVFSLALKRVGPDYRLNTKITVAGQTFWVHVTVTVCMVVPAPGAGEACPPPKDVTIQVVQSQRTSQIKINWTSVSPCCHYIFSTDNPNALPPTVPPAPSDPNWSRVHMVEVDAAGPREWVDPRPITGTVHRRYIMFHICEPCPE